MRVVAGPIDAEASAQRVNQRKGVGGRDWAGGAGGDSTVVGEHFCADLLARHHGHDVDGVAQHHLRV